MLPAAGSLDIPGPWAQQQGHGGAGTVGTQGSLQRLVPSRYQAQSLLDFRRS